MSKSFSFLNWWQPLRLIICAHEWYLEMIFVTCAQTAHKHSLHFSHLIIFILTFYLGSLLVFSVYTSFVLYIWTCVFVTVPVCLNGHLCIHLYFSCSLRSFAFTFHIIFFFSPKLNNYEPAIFLHYWQEFTLRFYSIFHSRSFAAAVTFLQKRNLSAFRNNREKEKKKRIILELPNEMKWQCIDFSLVEVHPVFLLLLFTLTRRFFTPSQIPTKQKHRPKIFESRT